MMCDLEGAPLALILPLARRISLSRDEEIYQRSSGKHIQILTRAMIKAQIASSLGSASLDIDWTSPPAYRP